MSNASSEQPAVPKPTPERPWGIAAALLIAVVGFILCQLLAQILVSLLPSAAGWTVAEIDRWLETPGASFIYVVLVEAFTIGLLIWFIRWRRADFRQVVGLRRLGGWDIPLAVLGFLCYILIYAFSLILLTNIVPIDTSQEQAVGFAHDVQGPGLAMAFVSLVILPPFVEEIMFRGFLFGTLRRRKLSFWWSALIVSLLFGAMHLFGGGGDSIIIWVAFIDTCILSFVLCYLREKTGAIWASIGLHALKNAFVFVNLFIISSR